ncbi:S8 family serine peptidase [uncultured Pseudokineococcus sp.]|uniref:S8 family serine peptidase n=1 Tax=uncultured Pseudokineococcus sp. TaxID=1642928 RepID=UPI002614B2B7|nr:S8 family serine peptidase [uncultured Pseudokineococcus sp.]
MTTASDAALSYRSGGRDVPISPDPELIAVRFVPSGRDAGSALEPRAAEVVRRASGVAFLAQHGVRVLRVPEGASGGALALDRDSAVDFSAPLVRIDGDERHVAVVLPQVVAVFPPDQPRAEVERLLDGYGATVVEAKPFLGNAYVVRSAEGSGERGPVALANRLVDDGHALMASPDLVRRIETRVLVAEPEAGSAREDRAAFDDEQWHLDTARVRGAWARTRGEGVTVAVLDDGVAVDHPEFAGKVRAQRDFAGGAAGAQPAGPDDNHGTACAGVAVAAGVKASGAAPEAGLVAARTPLWLGTADEVEMFRWAVDEGAQVISCSWGPAQPFALPDVTEEVLRWCAQDARRGKGVVVLFAAGNESEDMTTDGYAASPHVLAVAASTDADEPAWYSDFGPAVDIAAPSNGGTRAIFTTDRPGGDGYNDGSEPHGDDGYTATFGGTSSATPLVAGVAALVLSANPALTAAEVRDVLLSTAAKVGGADEYDADGHSTRFGHGRVDAAAAVDEAVRRQAAGPGTALGPVRVTGPAVAPRLGPPPTFQVDTGGRSLFAVEVATEAELLDAAHSHRRTDSTFFSSWEDGPETSSPYTLPGAVWERLRHAEVLAYRALAADDAHGADLAYSTPDAAAASAPSTRITEEPSSTTTLRFPSGARFAQVDDPQDGADYGDPVANGIVALLDTSGRLDEKLAASFSLRELAAQSGPYRYARVSVELVEGLQAMRSAAGAPLTVRSAYRPPALNTSVGGARRSQHLVGRAADIRVKGLTPLEVAELALEHLGLDIGLGLGSTTTHVDLRGTLATWVYTGAELSEEGFDDWARQQARRRGRRRVEREEAAERDWPAVLGPEEWSVGEPAPAFRVRSGRHPWVALELATDPRLFWPAATGRTRTPGTFAATWEQGMTSTGRALETTVTVPAELWRRLEQPTRVHYRCVTAARRDDWDEAESSLALEDADRAPSVRVSRSRRSDAWVDDATHRRTVERRWTQRG